MIPMVIPTVIYMPLDWVVARHTRNTLVAAVWNIVAVVVGKRAVEALSVVHDAVGVAVGGPFDN